MKSWKAVRDTPPHMQSQRTYPSGFKSLEFERSLQAFATIAQLPLASVDELCGLSKNILCVFSSRRGDIL
jgi:hypothetical protein